MIEFLQSGGIAIWFILVFGLVSLGAAVACAVRPAERRSAFFRALSRATGIAATVGTASGFAATLHHVANHPEWSRSPDRILFVMTGFAESLSNFLVGFGLLAIAWLVFAFAERRVREG
jgi:F0F1-type ATP synthase membrane subunit c/vacuolar-type H+-ATPase subunit K